MPELFINDIKMHCEHRPTDSSPHPPLLLLSGMASDSASWHPVIAPLSTQYELIIPDNRCTGRTTPNPIHTSREHNVNDLLALLDALGIERVNVLGHSMGAMIGWALAARAPERVNHLISASAISHAIAARVALFKTMGTLRSDQNEQQWFELLYQFLFSPSFFEHPAAVSQAANASIAYAHKQDSVSFANQAQALESFTTPIDTTAVRCPVSLLTGANDLLMTPALLQAFCAEHDYPFAIIPDAAHALHWEQTELFVAYVVNELA